MNVDMVACVGRAKAVSRRLFCADKLVFTFPFYIPALEKSFFLFAATLLPRFLTKEPTLSLGFSTFSKSE